MLRSVGRCLQVALGAVLLLCGPAACQEGSGTTPCDPNPCGTNQRCVVSADGNTQTCPCVPGWAAADCLTRVSCGTPTLDNGSWLGTVYTYDETIVFSCSAGFSLSGDPRAVCNSAGSWMGQPAGNYPTCVATSRAGCASSPCLNGGKCSDVNTNAGTVTCACTEGYSGDTCQTATTTATAQQFALTVKSRGTFTPQMSVRGSKEFEETCQRLVEIIRPGVEEKFPNRVVNLACNSLSQGSIIADLILTLSPVVPVTQEKVQEEVKAALTKITQVNNGTVPLHAFDELFTAVTFSSTGGTGVGLLPLYVVVGVFGLIILILIILILIYRFRNEKRKKKQRSRNSYSDEDSYEMDSMGRPGRGIGYPYKRGYFWRPPPRDLAQGYEDYPPSGYYPTVVVPAPGPSWTDRASAVYDWSASRRNNVIMYGDSWTRQSQHYV